MAGPGLYANIAKRKRGGKMRKKGAKGAQLQQTLEELHKQRGKDND